MYILQTKKLWKKEWVDNQNKLGVEPFRKTIWIREIQKIKGTMETFPLHYPRI